MSFKGVIEAKCPKGCEPFEAEVWSFINGSASPNLREALAAKECNLLLCPECHAPFFSQDPFIYFEPTADILVFVFPESFRAEEARWRKKMSEDFIALKQALGKNMPLDMEPEIMFGPEDLAELLNRETYRAEEWEVMTYVARELGLSLYKVKPHFARDHKMPGVLPFAPARGASMTRANLLSGLEQLLKANDRLTAYQEYLDALRAAPDAALPPGKA
ncbi:MAG: CpXC domain-containing protein [Elusimicrobiota bacterium]|jgi:hypothetical protein